MKVTTIKIPELSKKAYPVLTSNRNIMRMNKYQLAIVNKEAEIEGSEDFSDSIELNLFAVESTLSFIRSILDLDDETYELLLDVDANRTQEIAQKLTSYLMGMTDEDIKKMEESRDEDPKDQISGNESTI
ncbi:phage tail assembly chaperone [Streptococcus uberis]|uniref:phage tail assembly chaperone n=1 Tax=Streptococcus uberis TaxID=1349 RepID=UPI0020BEC75B|nr:phage tail assembly chaperone [Streptococcus uberis]